MDRGPGDKLSAGQLHAIAGVNGAAAHWTGEQRAASDKYFPSLACRLALVLL
jgi:hypothetical protein